jgi:hypothetical protein
MASGFHLIMPNAAPDLTFTASSTSGDSIAQNVSNPYRGEVWRATGCAAEWLKGTVATSQTGGGVAIAGTNLSANATVRARLYSDAAWTTPVYDSTATGLVSGANFWQIFFPAVAWRSIQIDFADATNPDGYVEATAVYVGNDFNPPWGVSWGAEISRTSTTKIELSSAGTAFASVIGVDYSDIKLTLDNLSWGDAQTLLDLCRLAGIGAYGWLCVDTALPAAQLVANSGEIVLDDYPRGKYTGPALRQVILTGKMV